MLRWMCKSKIHRLTITGSELGYEGSVSVDRDLLEAADIAPYEMVQIYNLHNGARFETYAIPAPKSSGEVCLNGAAARLGMIGDKIILVATAFVEDKDIASFVPRVIFVDEKNRPVKKGVSK
jgi:aspartate 1-decarboxylase